MATKKTTGKKNIYKETPKMRKENSKSVLGSLFVGIGLLFLLRDVIGFELSRAWPVILIGVGAYLLWFKKD